MSECVVRMEMPSDCERCPMCGTESCGNGMYKLWCMCGDIPASSQRRPEDCPIICSLPEGHGELIDRSKLFDWYTGQRTKYPVKQDSPQFGTMMMYEIFGEIDDAPTIVPAEAEAKYNEAAERKV